MQHTRSNALLTRGMRHERSVASLVYDTISQMNGIGILHIGDGDARENAWIPCTTE